MSPDDMQRFEVQGVWHNDSTAGLDFWCARCQHSLWPDEDDGTTLAELVQRAEEHTEVCR